MLLATILAYFPYAFVTAFTPGPNNVIALYTISRHGWREGKYTICGLFLGFLSVMVACAVFCYELARYIPLISDPLRYAGAAYILWLAFQVAKDKPGSGEGQKLSFYTIFYLQFLNVKIILYAITAYTAYVIPVASDLPFLLTHALCFTAIGMMGTLTWAAAGEMLQKFLRKHHRPFNLVMALVLVLCASELL